jgi:DNA replication factor GINS
MNLDELRTVRRKERQKDSLQHLRDSFYADVARYVDQLKDERQRAFESADQPFSDPEVQRLTDEIESAEEIVESIYERRVGKTVKLASFAAAEMPAETEGLTDEEVDLFEDLVERIQTNRETVLDTLAGKHRDDDAETDTADAPTSEPSDDPASAGGESGDEADPDPRAAEAAAFVEEDTIPDATETDAGDDVLADAMGGESTPGGNPVDPADSDDERAATDTSSAEPEPESDEREPDDATAERTTVRITDDVGDILAVDEREYHLEREDVLTLPAANAEPLIQNGAAERLD